MFNKKLINFNKFLYKTRIINKKYWLNIFNNSIFLNKRLPIYNKHLISINKEKIHMVYNTPICFLTGKFKKVIRLVSMDTKMFQIKCNTGYIQTCSKKSW